MEVGQGCDERGGLLVRGRTSPGSSSGRSSIRDDRENEGYSGGGVIGGGRSEREPLLAATGGGGSAIPPAYTAAEPAPCVTLTVPEAIDCIGYGWQQIRVLLICGLCFCTDSIEIGLLTFLQVEAKHTFHLSDLQESTLTAIVFGGELFGSIFWGPVADRFGRRKGAFFPAILVTLAGVASAFAVDFYMLTALRFLVGFGIGGMGVPYDLLAEFMPSHIRGKALFSIEFFWTFGTLFVNGLAWIMLDKLGWRYLVGLCAIPVAIATLSFPFLPESPHWLLTVRRDADAVRVLRRAAKLNGKPDALPSNMRLVNVFEIADNSSTFEVKEMEAKRSDGKRSGSGPSSTTSGCTSESTDNGDDDGDDYNNDNSGGNGESQHDLSTSVVPAGNSVNSDRDARMEAGHMPAGAGDASPQEDDHATTTSTASPLHLFNPTNAFTTRVLWLIWGTFGFAYYGSVIITPEYFSGWDHHHNSTTNGTNMTLFGTSFARDPDLSASSASLQHDYHGHEHHGAKHDFDYPALFTAGAAELFGAIVGVFLIDRINRRPLAGTAFLISSIFMMLVIIDVPRSVGILFVVLARMAIFIGSCVTWVLTPELYATNVRAAGHGWCNGMARLAAFATPYWGDATGIPLWARLLLYGAMSLLSAVGSFLLPRETRGTALQG